MVLLDRIIEPLLQVKQWLSGMHLNSALQYASQHTHIHTLRSMANMKGNMWRGEVENQTLATLQLIGNPLYPPGHSQKLRCWCRSSGTVQVK